MNTPMTELAELKLNAASKDFLKETVKWTSFLSILGFLGVALLVLLGLFSTVIFSAIPQAQSEMIPFDMGVFFTILYLVLALLYFFPVYYLFKFSHQMKAALQSKDDEILSRAFEMLKSHYKFIGVFTIITLSLYLLVFIVSLLGVL